MERQLPKNVRQIGNVSDNPKIYVEDYVDTYLNQLREKAREQPVGVILTGELLKLEDENAVFVSGAVQMKEVKTNGNDIETTDEIMKEAKEETGIKNVTPISNNIYSLEIINVNGHEKRGKYVGSHVHLNVTYLLEADENEEIHIKEDENSGVKWVPIDEVLNVTSEIWVRDRVYTKIIEKMKMN